MSVHRFLAATLAASLSVALLPVLGLAQPEAVYTVRFDATWSEETHPIDFPSNPHFSGLIGGAHNGGVSFWDLGGLASPGIESMAETGSKVLLQGEVQDAINDGTATAIISGGGIPVSPGMVSKIFTMTETYPLVTLVSMLAPSPDWFVGVSGLSLREDGDWVPVKVVELVVYDAGTDSGTMYGSPNQPTQPPIPIYEKTEVPFNENQVVGTFTFTRDVTGLPGAADPVQLRIRSLGPNPTRATSRIEIRAAREVLADLQVYDTAGRLVRTLLPGERLERRTVVWDGRDLRGNQAPTGIYYVTLRAGSETRSTKLMLIR